MRYKLLVLKGTEVLLELVGDDLDAMKAMAKAIPWRLDYSRLVWREWVAESTQTGPHARWEVIDDP